MILHLDMDAFFAAVEQMDNPELRGRPVIVGGGERGVVATASYEARAYGVHSAMPVVTARKLCPRGIFVRGNYRRYSGLSRQIMAALKDFSPVIQQASIDEAYLDVKGIEDFFPSHLEIARAIKRKVAQTSGGLTCSIGMAPVKFLAKICSDINKPDGVFILEREEVDDFLLTLNVEKIPGVGKHMSASLRELGITTIRQLRQLSRHYLLDRFGKWGGALHERAWGIDPRQVHENAPARSESSEHTFEKDIAEKRILNATLEKQAEKVGAALRKNGFSGRTITLKIKFADFRQITRSRTISGRTNSSRTIFAVARDLLRAEHLPMPVRLIGVGVSGFEMRQEQLFLPGIKFPRAGGEYEAMERSLDRNCSARIAPPQYE